MHFSFQKSNNGADLSTDRKARNAQGRSGTFARNQHKISADDDFLDSSNGNEGSNEGEVSGSSASSMDEPDDDQVRNADQRHNMSMGVRHTNHSQAARANDFAQKTTVGRGGIKDKSVSKILEDDGDQSLSSISIRGGGGGPDKRRGTANPQSAIKPGGSTAAPAVSEGHSKQSSKATTEKSSAGGAPALLGLRGQNSQNTSGIEQRKDSTSPSNRFKKQV